MPAKQRKKAPPQTTRDYLTTLEHALRQLSYSQHLFTTFQHFVELSAIAFSNVADPINKAVREAQYLAIVKLLATTRDHPGGPGALYCRWGTVDLETGPAPGASVRARGTAGA